MELRDFVRQLPAADLWVFAYGSLMWSPGFRFLEKQPARVHGYHRSLCVLSYRHRGSPERPGLVVGLQAGGSCRGLAFKVAAARTHAVLRALWQREMTYRVYRPRVVLARLQSGAAVPALAFIADPLHPQHAGELDLQRMAHAVAHGRGGRGRNIDYLRRTLAHMPQLGVPDPHLEKVLQEAEALSRATDPHPPKRTARRASR